MGSLCPISKWIAFIIPVTEGGVVEERGGDETHLEAVSASFFSFSVCCLDLSVNLESNRDFGYEKKQTLT